MNLLKMKQEKRKKISVQEIFRRSIGTSIKADGDFINLLRQYVADQRQRFVFIAVIWVIESSSKECSVPPLRWFTAFRKKASQSKVIQEFSSNRPSLGISTTYRTILNLTSTGARKNYPSNSPLIWWNSHTCFMWVFSGP